MTGNFSRALVLSTILAGPAAITAIGMTTTIAQAASVRSSVGNALQDAINLAKQGKGSAATAKLNTAEAVGGLTAPEKKAIAQTREYIFAKTGVGVANSATSCKVKFAADYNAKRYSQVVSEDANCLSRYGVYDARSKLIVAQSHYLMSDYASAIQVLRGLPESENSLKLLLTSARASGDLATEQKAAERLVLRGPENWTYALAAAEHTAKLSDRELLNLNRIRFLTGNMKKSADYTLLIQLALQFGFPAEAYAIGQHGVDTAVLEPSKQRLVTFANTAMKKDMAQLDKNIAQAKSEKSGEMAVKVGQDLWGYRRYDEAVALIKLGLAKGVTDTANARIALAMAELSNGQKDNALKTLSAKDSEQSVVTNLWSLYVRTNQGAVMPAPSANAQQSSQMAGQVSGDQAQTPAMPDNASAAVAEKDNSVPAAQDKANWSISWIALAVGGVLAALGLAYAAFRKMRRS